MKQRKIVVFTVCSSGLAGASRGALCAALDTRTRIDALTPDRCPDIPNVDLKYPFPGLRHEPGTDANTAVGRNMLAADLTLIVTHETIQPPANIGRMIRFCKKQGIEYRVVTPTRLTGELRGFVENWADSTLSVCVEGESERQHPGIHLDVCRALTAVIGGRTRTPYCPPAGSPESGARHETGLYDSISRTAESMPNSAAALLARWMRASGDDPSLLLAATGTSADWKTTPTRKSARLEAYTATTVYLLRAGNVFRLPYQAGETPIPQSASRFCVQCNGTIPQGRWVCDDCLLRNNKTMPLETVKASR